MAWGNAGLNLSPDAKTLARRRSRLAAGGATKSRVLELLIKAVIAREPALRQQSGRPAVAILAE